MTLDTRVRWRSLRGVYRSSLANGFSAKGQSLVAGTREVQAMNGFAAESKGGVTSEHLSRGMEATALCLLLTGGLRRTSRLESLFKHLEAVRHWESWESSLSLGKNAGASNACP